MRLEGRNTTEGWEESCMGMQRHHVSVQELAYIRSRGAFQAAVHLQIASRLPMAAAAAAAAADQARAAAVKARDEASQLQRSMGQKSPSSNRFLRIIAFLTAGVDVVAIAATAAAGGGLALLLATPLFLLFSPVLVPLAIVVAIATGGFVAASAAFLLFCSFVAWIFNYVKGRHPVGADKLDAIKSRISSS